MDFSKENTKYNKGLHTRFKIIDGKFGLIGGKYNVDDNVSMLSDFIGWFRIFKQDYVIDVYRFYQNTTNHLNKFKNIFKYKVMAVGKDYVPFANFYAVDIVPNSINRKEVEMIIQFRYNLKDETSYQIIRKIVL